MNSLLGRVPARGESVQWREFGSETILLDPMTGQFAHINASGIAIWEHIDGRRTIDEITAQVAGEFGADPEDILTDVQAFLGDLIDKHLVTLVT